MMLNKYNNLVIYIYQGQLYAQENLDKYKQLTTM